MKTLLLGLVVLITQLMEAVTGFGSTVMAMPFATMLVGLPTAVRVLVTLTFIMCGSIALAERRHIQWRVYGAMMLFVGLGMPIGMWLFSRLDERVLKWALGGFTIVIAIRGLLFSRPATHQALPRWQAALYKGALFLGGVVHGAFGCGGPLIVLYAAQALPEKRDFRATMCLNWTTLNAVHLLRYTARGEWTPEIGWLLLAMLPFLTVSVWLGGIAMRRLSGQGFMKVVYAVLLGSGMFMFV